jgi:hypothetical protein
MNARVQTLCRMSTLLPTKGQSTKENPPCSHLSRGEILQIRDLLEDKTGLSSQCSLQRRLQEGNLATGLYEAENEYKERCAVEYHVNTRNCLGKRTWKNTYKFLLWDEPDDANGSYMLLTCQTICHLLKGPFVNKCLNNQNIWIFGHFMLVANLILANQCRSNAVIRVP